MYDRHIDPSPGANESSNDWRLMVGIGKKRAF